MVGGHADDGRFAAEEAAHFLLIALWVDINFYPDRKDTVDGAQQIGAHGSAARGLRRTVEFGKCVLSFLSFSMA